MDLSRGVKVFLLFRLEKIVLLVALLLLLCGTPLSQAFTQKSKYGGEIINTTARTDVPKTGTTSIFDAGTAAKIVTGGISGAVRNRSEVDNSGADFGNLSTGVVAPVSQTRRRKFFARMKKMIVNPLNRFGRGLYAVVDKYLISVFRKLFRSKQVADDARHFLMQSTEETSGTSTNGNFWYSTSPGDSDLYIDKIESLMSTTNRGNDDAVHQRFDTVIDSFFPRGRKIPLQLMDGRKFPLIRKNVLGFGGFGVVAEVEGPNGGSFAAKIFALQGGATPEQIQKTMENESNILKILPSELTPYQLYENNRLAMPIELAKISKKKHLIKSQDGSVVYVNIIMLMPKFEMDVKKLLGAIESDYSPDANLIRLSIIEQSIRLLASFHELGMVHADYKPENLFIKKNGIIYLGDFGIARRMGQNISCFLFSLEYVSPEQGRCFLYENGDVTTDQRPSLERTIMAYASMDSWALGVVIYRLWCANNPYGLVAPSDADGAIPFLDALAKLDSVPEDFFSTCNASMPTELKGIILGLLHLNPIIRTRPQALLTDKPLTLLLSKSL